jgi:UDP-glucose 4-epimerase
VNDVVRCLIKLLDDPGAIGQEFNVGSSEEITILELARRIVERANSRSSIEMIPYDRAYNKGFEDMQRRVPDTTKVETLTGWHPELSLDQILDDAIADAQEESRFLAATEEIDLTAHDPARSLRP